MKEIVIAAYEREYSRWVSQLNPNIKVTVYRKGHNHNLENEIYLENNVGRDVHTFFYHIVNRYDSLSEYTFTSQDDFTYHVNNYIDIINTTSKEWDKHAMHKFEECWFFCTSHDKILECDKTGMPNHGGLPIEKIWNELFDMPCPEKIYFPPGGHFCISDINVKKRPLYFYEKIVNILETDVSSPYVFERLEPYVFNTNYKIK
jgi:hypothetical protein